MTVWRKVGCWVISSLVLAVAALPAWANSTEKVEYYTVGADDTLGSIALRFKVSPRDLKSWNNLSSLDITPGASLVVKGEPEQLAAPAPRAQAKAPASKPSSFVHVVRSGDTFESIARRYRVSIDQVKAWNTRINPRRMQIGQHVRLYSANGRQPEAPVAAPPELGGRSSSTGAANRGRLFNGIALQDTYGLKVRDKGRSYGTRTTVQLLEAIGADVQARWPDAPALLVGDLSHPGGGPMRPHKSHQSGRDVDINYYHRGNVPLSGFRQMDIETFDAAKNWHFFKMLIDSGQVEYVFVDYKLQRVLYEYAREIGYSPEELARVIQYPRSPKSNFGLIRHVRGHADHMHIRFKCQSDDTNCR